MQGYSPKYHFDFHQTDEMSEAMKAYFFVALRQRVLEEWDISAYADFVQHFYQSRFNESFSARTEEMSQHIMTIYTHSPYKDAAFAAIDRYIDAELNKNLDFFFIVNCRQLLPIELPQGILRHSDSRLQDIDLLQLIQDYLDLEREGERYYTDISRIPEKKMQNAFASFLHCEPDEIVLLISDQTLLGSFKEGFAFTEHGLYWKAPMNKPAQVFYGDIVSVERNRSKLLINGHYFNTSQSINIKMMLLLKKIRQLFA